MSILAGIDELVDDWLSVEPKGSPPHYRHRAAANELTRRRAPVTDALPFLKASYVRIHANWLAAIDAGYTNPSKENWRWKRHPDLGANNRSPELKLERAIVKTCGDNWSNQMPTASGLIGPATDKRAAVDLVLRNDAANYSLIELKVNSNTPLFAAIEIVKYGLLLVWSKNKQEYLGYDPELQPILAAHTVTLGAWAPADYYRNLDLTSLASTLDGGLAEFGRQYGINFSFEYCQLGENYMPELAAESVRLAVENRQQIWCDK